jgi:hypothetical protein
MISWLLSKIERRRPQAYMGITDVELAVSLLRTNRVLR